MPRGTGGKDMAACRFWTVGKESNLKYGEAGCDLLKYRFAESRFVRKSWIIEPVSRKCGMHQCEKAAATACRRGQPSLFSLIEP